MSVRAPLLLACLTLATVAAAPALAADPQREIHGMADAYAGQGVALAWGVLRGADEAGTLVVVRIVADPDLYPIVAANGSNPFSRRAQSLLPATPNPGSIDVRTARAHFADFPRTELRFYESVAAAQSETPRLVVYFLGVPDTTPEFATEANLAAYLADRIARVRAPGAKAP
ncbi:MAG TPA: hypothetical protein VGK75_04420 [Casimicrobiaceae bacterium]|jgi:hypothetical protein